MPILTGLQIRTAKLTDWLILKLYYELDSKRFQLHNYVTDTHQTLLTYLSRWVE